MAYTKWAEHSYKYQSRNEENCKSYQTRKGDLTLSKYKWVRATEEKAVSERDREIEEEYTQMKR